MVRTPAPVPTDGRVLPAMGRRRRLYTQGPHHPTCHPPVPPSRSVHSFVGEVRRRRSVPHGRPKRVRERPPTVGTSSSPTEGIGGPDIVPGPTTCHDRSTVPLDVGRRSWTPGVHRSIQTGDHDGSDLGTYKSLNQPVKRVSLGYTVQDRPTTWRPRRVLGPRPGVLSTDPPSSSGVRTLYGFTTL